MVISLLDNAASIEDMSKNSSATSSALLLALDKPTCTATVLRSYPRPDGSFTRLRGNLQWLPSGASLAHWSDNNYFCEYDAEGRMVQEAQLLSNRFESYRTYKFNWTSLTPAEKPVIKGFAYGTEPSRATTALYTSWNGATEVTTWRFYGIVKESERVIAVVLRTKFETVAMADGFFERTRATALDLHGNELGSSEVLDVEIPVSWSRSLGRNSTDQDSFEVISVSGEREDERDSISNGLRAQIVPTSFALVNLAMRSRDDGLLSASSLFPLFDLMALASGATIAFVWGRRRKRSAWSGMP